MPNISRRLIAIVAIPIVFIAIGLPIALAVVNDSGGEDYGGEGDATPPSPESTVVAGQQPPLPPNSTRIRMLDLAFVPDETIIDVDIPVAFLNDDTTQHTATLRNSTVSGAEFDSGTIDPGTHVVWTPTEPGEYEFECKIHPNTMQMTVTVRPR